MRENVMCETVKETDDDQDERIRNHYDLIAKAVNDFPHKGRREETAYG